MSFQLIKSIIENSDLIGPQMGIERKGSTKFKSLYGGILSLISIGVIAFISSMFGTEIYQRQQPNIAISQDFIDNSLILANGLPLWFDLYTNNGTYLPNIWGYISVDMLLVKFVPEIGPVVTPTPFFLEQCGNTTTRFPQYYQYIDLDPYNSWCINVPSNFSIANDLYSINSASVVMYVYKCDATKTKCADDLETQFDNLYFVMGNLNSFVSSTNYTTPVSYFREQNNLNLGNQMQKNIVVNFLNNAFLSDNGWIFDDVQTINYIQRQDFIYQYNVISSDSLVERLLIQFASPRLITKTTRNYMKVQELFAKIGGIATAVMMIANAISFHYLRFIYLFSIRDYSINDIQDIKEKNSSIINIQSQYSSPIKNPGHSINYISADLNQLNINKCNILEDNNKVINNNINCIDVNVAVNNNNSSEVVNQNIKNFLGVGNSTIVRRFQNSYKKSPQAKSIQDLFHIEAKNLNYFGYISSIIFCKTEIKENYQKLLNGAESIICIETFSKLVTNFTFE